jgi:hypothetical protein
MYPFMTIDEAAVVYSALTQAEQVRVLASFAHGLTIAARDTYEFQAPGVRAPERLRAINEVQHRVLAHICSLLAQSELRYPDDVLVSIMLSQDDDQHLRGQAMWAFQEGLKKSKVVPSA